MEALKNMLDDINPYVKLFRTAREMLRHNDVIDLKLRIIHSRNNRQYIQPTSNEIVVVIVGENNGQISHRDIILFPRDGNLQRISEIHPSYMPLQYPLLFPYGTDGWRCGINFAPTADRARSYISMREFYAFRIQFRESEGKLLLQGGRLFQQFVVDAYAAIEHNNLNFLRTHQSDLRADLYQGLEDAIVAGDTDASAVGRRFVLPSSFTGGPRNMMQHYQDAMAICRYLGPPDLFITFTCNPNWPEIKQELQRIPGQRVEDRPDITARAFRIRQKRYIDDIKINKFFGRVTSGKIFHY